MVQAQPAPMEIRSFMAFRTIRNKNRREKVRLTDQKRQKAEGRGERELEERPRVNRVFSSSSRLLSSLKASST